MAESSCGLCRVEKAICECECSSLQLCSTCILPHLCIPESHMMKPILPIPQSLTLQAATPSIPVPQTASETCFFCLSAHAAHVCTCENTGVVLCTKCISLHTSKVPKNEHMTLSLKAWPFVGRPGYVDRLQLRQNSLKVSIANMEKHISLIESCKLDLQSRVEDFIQFITNYRNTKTEELTQYANFLHQNLELVNTEIADNIYDEDYMPLSDYATAVWTSKQNQEDLFGYTKSGKYEVKMCMRLKPDLSFTPITLGKKSKVRKQKVSTTTVSFPAPAVDSVNSSGSLDPARTLVRVLDMHLCINDCLTGLQTANLAVPSKISSMSSVLVLPDGNIFISGRSAPISAFAFEICPKTGLITQRKNMLVPRFGHGTLYSNGSIYVFGGTGLQGKIDNCEALQMKNKQWRPLASLQQARDFFNPCLYESSVFILGGRNTTVCEQYSIPENTFTLLPFQVPEGGECTSLVTSKSILYLRKKHIIKFSLESMRLEWETVIQTSPSVGWSVVNPILIGNTLHFAKPYFLGTKRVKLPAKALQ